MPHPLIICSNDILLLTRSICSTLTAYQEAIRECGGLAQFTSIKDKPIFCTSHDVSQQLVKFNCTTNKMMVVRNRGGNQQLSPQDFVNVSFV